MNENSLAGAISRQQDMQQRGYIEEQLKPKSLATACQVRDQSPVEMALDQLQKMIEAGCEEMLELSDRLSPVTDLQIRESCTVAESPKSELHSHIEVRLAHMLERAAMLKSSLRQMRDELRI